MPVQFHPFISGRWELANNDYIKHDEWYKSETGNSFAFIPDPEIKSIFLGSFPTYEICGDNVNNNLVEFFYGSAVNNFWPILGAIFDSEAGTFEDRSGILRAHKIGITDILRKVDREPWNCSEDSCLTVIEYNDILALLKRFPSIKNIFMTSGGKGRISPLNENNQNVATWFRDSLRDELVQGFNQSGFIKTIKINNIDLNLVYLYSPSRHANRRISKIIEDLGLECSSLEFRKIQWAYFLNKLHFNNAQVPPTATELLEMAIENHQLTNFFEN